MGNDLAIVLELDSKGAVKGFKGIDGALKGFDKATKKAKSSMAGMWKQMAIGLGVTNLISGAFRKVTSAITGSISAVIEFEKQFANVTTLLNQAADDPAILRIREDILDLAGPLGSATELTKGLYQAISAGQKPAKAVEFVAQAAMFAQGALADMSSSVKLLTGFLNSYELESFEVTRVSDIMFQVIKDGVTTGQELASSLSSVIPTAAQMGISIEEIGAAMATMTKFTLSTQEATVALNQTLLSILKPTDQAAALAEKMGLNFSKAGIEGAGGLQGFLMKLKKEIGDDTKTMSELFPNIRALKGAFILAGQGAETFKKELVLMKKAGEEGRNTIEAFEKQQKTFGATMTALKNKLEAVFIKALLPALQDLASWLKANSENIVDYFKAGIENAKNIIGFFLEWKDVIIQVGKAWLIYFSLNKLNAFRRGFISAFSKMQLATGGLGAKIKAMPKMIKISMAFIGLELLNTAISMLDDYYNNEQRLIIESTKLSKERDDLWRKLTAEQKNTYSEILKAEKKSHEQKLKTKNLELERLRITGEYSKDLDAYATLVEEVWALEKMKDEDFLENAKKTFLAQIEKEKQTKKEIEDTEKGIKNWKDFFNELTKGNEVKEKAVTLTEEQIKAIEEQNKVMESLSKTMGILTNKSYKELLTESKNLNKIWEANKDTILKNADSTKLWKEKIEGINKKITDSGREIPQSNLKITKSIDDQQKSYDELNNMIGKTLPLSTVNLTDKIIQLTIKKALAKKAAEDLAKEQKELADQFEKTKEKIKQTTENISGVIDGLFDMGIIGSKTAGNLMEAVGGVADVFKNLNKPLDENFTKFDRFRGVAGGVATAIGGLIGASDRTKQALQGLASGVSDLYQGIATGKPLKIIAGALKTLGSLIKLFSKDHVGNAIKAQNSWMNLTEEQTEALRKLEKEVGNVHAATSIMLDELMDGNVTLQNSDKWLFRIRETLIDMGKGVISAKDGVDAINKSFKVWLDQAKKLGTAGSKEFHDFVSDLRTQGVEVEEINKFVMESFMKGLESYKRIRDVMTGDDEISREMEDLNDELKILNTELDNAKEGSKDYINAAKKIDEVTAELSILENKLSDITDIQEIFGGLSIDVYDDIIDMENRVAENQTLFNAIDDMNELMLDFSNSTKLTEEQFDDFGLSAELTYNKLIEKGFSSEEALAAISPTLKRLKFLQEEFGFSTEDSVKALIDEADSLKLLKSDPIDEMVAGIKDMTGTMKEFINLLSEKMGLVTRNAADGIDDISNSVGGLERRIKDFDAQLPDFGGGDFQGFAKGTGSKMINAPGLFTLAEEGPERVDFSGNRMRVTPTPATNNNNTQKQKPIIIENKPNIYITGTTNMTDRQIVDAVQRGFDDGTNKLITSVNDALKRSA
jgi:TP901 family phage tail tape measure protein